MTKFKAGEHVVLPEFEDEPRQNAVVLYVEEGNGMYVVQVEPEEEGDDGIREVHEDQMEKLQ